MIEKVNPFHPDKVADRIAGALVDLAYSKQANPKVAVEVLIGHGECNVIIESSYEFTQAQVEKIVKRLAGKDVVTRLNSVPQDVYLADNQSKEVRCGDNGIFKGVPLTKEEKELAALAREIAVKWPYDGKYILNGHKLTVCQSNAKNKDIEKFLAEKGYKDPVINPLGEWTGGTNVDSGATNRKLGSDMAQSVTGGGLAGKDLTKADVSANIWAFVKAQETGKVVQLSCSIGDTEVRGFIGKRKISVPYKEVVEFARDYVKGLGGFEAFADWGLY